MTVAQLKEIIKHIEEHGYECVLVEKSKDSFIFIDVTINGKEMRLKCEFPVSFPYEFPKVYILDVFYKSISPLPHIDSKGYICNFDSNISYPNYEKPKELVLNSIEKAIKIIKDGMEGVNRADFIEEFKAYWQIDCKIIADALFIPGDMPRKLSFYQNMNLDFYIGENESQLREYLTYAKNIEIKDDDLEKCLYLPLNGEWYPPFPKTNKELYLKVQQNSECFKAYYDFIKDRTKKSLIIFSQIINGSVCLAGWIHKPVKTPRGFRRGKILPELIYLCTNKDEEVIKFDVAQLTHKRLYNRGGDGGLLTENKVSITGCGSVGSYLTRSLAELGVYDFVLIDKDIITSDNIARHYCGASFIGKYKVEAIKEALISHYVDIKCEAIKKNIFEVIEGNIETFNACDYNFIVVGYRPIESKFIELINEKVITKPVILLWVEPYMLGGHAVIIQNPQEIEDILYDSENNFTNSILVEGHKYTKKEAGCQSTFIPYSGFEVQQFIYDFIDYFNNNILSKKVKGNILFSWCGRLDWARQNNIMISDMWLAKSNRTHIVKRLD